jgi:hypothetical protein
MCLMMLLTYLCACCACAADNLLKFDDYEYFDDGKPLEAEKDAVAL